MEIPDSYPHKLSNEKIMEIISSCSEISVKATKKNSNYSLGPSFYNSMAELGLVELNKRNQQDLLKVIEQQRLDNKRAGLINKALSVITIILAFSTIYIGRESLHFSKNNEVSDIQWKTEQIELLKQNNIELKNISKYLESQNQKEISHIIEK